MEISSPLKIFFKYDTNSIFKISDYNLEYLEGFWFAKDIAKMTSKFLVMSCGKKLDP